VKGYTARDVATMLGISPAQVRAYATTGFLTAERGDRGEFRFTFQDIVLLRTAVGLTAANIPPRKVLRSLKKLKAQLPSGRPLTAVRIAADGDQIIVRDGGSPWNPESGQYLLDFAVSDLASKVAPIDRQTAAEAREEEDVYDAEDWYALGCELEIGSPRDARDAYRRAIELDPAHTDAHVNLGRLLHEENALNAAEAHYRIALEGDPHHPIAAFNLGVVLEDLGKLEEAVQVYERATENDPASADAYYNLAGVFEELGNHAAAFRCLKRYRDLVAPKRG
jgi:tetratricopeptide (TPR) repeat protein